MVVRETIRRADRPVWSRIHHHRPDLQSMVAGLGSFKLLNSLAALSHEKPISPVYPHQDQLRRSSALRSREHPLNYEYQHDGTAANALHAFVLPTNHKMRDARSMVLGGRNTVVGGPDSLAAYPPRELTGSALAGTVFSRRTAADGEMQRVCSSLLYLIERSRP